MSAEAEELAGDEAGDDEVPELEQAPAAPSHEPYSFKLWAVVQQHQSSNGLRHSDHLRYRQYCARRLRRLHCTLGFKHGRGRYKQVAFPGDFTDTRYFEIPLVNAERAWSYGVQLKADNAAAAALNPRWRHHSINRFAKAVKWAQMLESVCKIHGDQRTQLEAESYAAFLEGTWLLEKEMWQEALAKLTRCRRLCEHLGLASEPAEAALFKAKVQEMAPMLRECRYSLGLDYDGAEGDEDAVKPRARPQKDLSELSYRGHILAVPSERLQGKLARCLQLARSVKVDGEEDSAAVIEKYGEVTNEFAVVLKDIHTDMINAGSEGTTDEWRMLEAFARELSICMSVERNLVLLGIHLAKLDSLEEIGTPEARRVCRPEEGMRYCDLLKEDIQALFEMPETTEAISEVLNSYARVAQDYRCLFLGLCFVCMGKALEAAALMDMLFARVQGAELAADAGGALGRLHLLFDGAQSSLPSRTAQWRCRGLAQLCSETRAKAKDEEGLSKPSQKLGDLGGLAAFPPGFRDIPCKPLLFDLAFPCIKRPDLDQLHAASQAGEGQQKGFLGRVAGGLGLGNRLGGLWGRK